MAFRIVRVVLVLAAVLGVNALQARGVDVPYMVKENEGHGFRNEGNQFDFYEAMDQFLAKYLGKS